MPLCPGKMYHVKSRELLLMVAEDTHSHYTSNLQCVRVAQAPGNSAGHKATFINQWLPKEPSSLALKPLKGSVLTIVLFSGRKPFVLGEPARQAVHPLLGSIIRITGIPSPICLRVSKKAAEALGNIIALMGGSGEGKS